VIRAALLALAAAACAALAFTATAQASTWCGAATGADLLPQAVGGPSVHLVYAYPSDGADRLAEFGTTMQTDAEAIDGWWRAQDPARAPRFDTFGFGCGVQLDITEVKLASTTAELVPYDGRFQRILTSVAGAGLTSPYEVYVVYYDGPDDQGRVCGETALRDPNSGPRFAMVYTGACPGEPTATTTAHELTHALGAVIPPAPHECPPPNDGHVCDYPHDLMYPFADGTPLSGLALDIGRDDYYGAAGIGFDVRASRWLRHLDEPTAHVSVVFRGAGTVTSDVPGVLCSTTCAREWDAGQTVMLKAEPAAGQRFVRWSGSCTGGGDCAITTAGTPTVTALFAPQTFSLTIGLSGAGSILNSAAGTVCSRRCRLALTSYEPVTLRAVAKQGWRFRRWVGGCKGTRPTCRLPMTAATTTTAMFAKRRG
jgi:Fe-S cluster biogenesis protein NfuA